jgi:hypothetical protein
VGQPQYLPDSPNADQRKQQKALGGSVDEMAELREHAAAHAALFNLGAEEADTAEEASPSGRISE